MSVGKTRFVAMVALIVGVLMLAGCGTMSEKVIGLWKSTVPVGGKIQFLEIATNYILDNAERTQGTVLEDKGTSVWVKAPFLGGVVAMSLIINDDGSMNVQEGERESIKYVRATKAEYDLEFTPPIAQVLGLYKTPDNLEIWEITATSWKIDGKEPQPITLTSGNRHYTMVVGSGNAADTLDVFAAVTDGKKVLGIERNSYPRFSKKLIQITPDDATKLREEIKQSYDNKMAILKKAQGTWIAVPDYVEDASGEYYSAQHVIPTLEITDTEIIGKNSYRNEKHAIVPTVLKDKIGYKGTGKNARPDELIMEVVKLSDDGQKLEISSQMLSRSKWQRIDKKTAENINNPTLENLTGYWVMKKSNYPTYKVICLNKNALWRDGFTEQIRVPNERSDDSRALLFGRQNFRNLNFGRIIRNNADQITIYNDNDFREKAVYQRTTAEEAKAQAVKNPNKILKLAGYWLSTTPMQANKLPAQIAISLGVKDDATGIVSEQIERLNYSSSNDYSLMQGALVFDDGNNITKQIYLLSQSKGCYYSIQFVDDNKLTIQSHVHSSDTLTFVRSDANGCAELIKRREATHKKQK